MTLEEREENLIKIKDSGGIEHTYDILQHFPFSSETKRMGIILKEQETDQIMFYVKGAEVVMESKISPEQRVSMIESCEQLASDGLRTLVISQKVLDPLDYAVFE
jgi:phospholipid-translocating ATPase